ncbi:fatty acid desaturase [Aquitalea aquatica]|uniref:Fatty acid desaturase n=1 Tax=Aquitalea aquatica TaxID=3044273 RepID=A0A838Y1X4_9NEIS|nr:fatty acid desaturase [Aquitalea magnusonii]MBA4707272.1 fatty acid desaturase [Aquitalea magnusonii]
MYCSLQHAGLHSGRLYREGSAIPDSRDGDVAPSVPAGQSGSRAWLARLELPTWLLIAVIYGGWFGTAALWRQLGPWLGTPLLIVFTSWYMSLQHELIHGHPTRHGWLNALFGQLPLAVWYPYAVYRDSHLAHHRDESLTLPGVDPESYYHASLPAGAVARGLLRWRNTAVGRLLLGPALGWLATLRAAVRSGQRQQLLVWGSHLLLLGLLLLWLRQAGIAPWYYLSCIAYPALALAMVRSFYEHRAVPDAAARSVLNEAAWPWRLLFLNLNYHLVHHLHPGLPWYRLRQAYLAERQHYQQLSGDFVEQGYLPLLWRHRRRPVIDTLHPFA